ncbi:accessory Sec system translocase SecA2 [Paucilactobacillus suebicus]|uniref:Protein translocase subunit SecA n=1 Tax=Paucilactobacillus suebicus DSM 5007 = KCTC 3549 TaxID=1423807 RepID=A0A0R1VW44_9LACO|nr:accessory Sec system translocase SecA2 [Paucilactobacillus suebicus]KRM09936.1 preprotein translocase subunit SecA [Paucilactobacillus suebicus DSM 5007 = KCTC 3549]
MNNFRENFRLRKYNKIAQQIIDLAPKYQQMSDHELQGQTVIFKQRLQDGETLDDLMVEAYAVAREADNRVLGLEPYFVQVVGAIILHDGNIAEMKTGEGKTLTATMPMYLNGLLGVGNFLITANPYLAVRDATEMGVVYRWLGLTIEAGVLPEGSDDEINKDQVYAADIVYTTNSSLGFDYLIDNLASTKSSQHMQGFRYALIDEVDSILLDMAQTPLIISGAPKVQSNLFESTDRIVKMLDRDVDVKLSDDTKKAWFTETGIQTMESYFGITGLLSPKWKELYRHLVLALKANYLYIRNKAYVVADGEVLLLDEANGRALEGTQLESGLHQAIEAKEGVKVSTQSRAMASVTYQNLFRMFKKLSGMSGTAKTDVKEFRQIYNLNVYTVPTHKPTIRQDHPDKMFVTNKEKIYASVDQIKQAYDQKRPVLIETGSVSMSNLYSRLMLREGIVHNLLNARSEAKEARIVEEAGQPGAITVATSMAGRGTDIKLGPGVKEKGGLLVVGTERMESERIDNQLRGRAGRQGDPGDSIFYVSLEDKIVVQHGPKWVKRFRKTMDAEIQSGKRTFGKRLVKHRFKRIIHHVQVSAEAASRSERFQTLEYDEIFRVQRDTIYQFRDQMMQNDDLQPFIDKIFTDLVEDFAATHHDLTTEDITDFIYNTMNYNYVPNRYRLANLDRDDPSAVSNFLMQELQHCFKQQRAKFTDDAQFLYYERLTILKAIDNAWIEHVDNLQQLKAVVTNRSTAQRNPVYEYQKESKMSFEKMKQTFWQNATKYLLLSTLKYQPNGKIDVEFP